MNVQLQLPLPARSGLPLDVGDWVVIVDSRGWTCVGSLGQIEGIVDDDGDVRAIVRDRCGVYRPRVGTLARATKRRRAEAK